jgi:hypothetical protein
MSLQDSVDSNHSCYKFTNGKTVWGKSPEAIGERSTYQHYGGNIKGVKTFGEHPDMISGLKKSEETSSGRDKSNRNKRWMKKSMIIEQTLKSFSAKQLVPQGFHTAR